MAQGRARPVRMEAMIKAKTIDTAASDALPAITGTPVFQTQDQVAAASKYLLANWAAAIK